jgi:hypothetical protein
MTAERLRKAEDITVYVYAVNSKTVVYLSLHCTKTAYFWEEKRYYLRKAVMQHLYDRYTFDNPVSDDYDGDAPDG